MFLLTIYLPWLLNMFPYSYWASTCMAALPTYSAFMISVRQASDLPPASFRFPVTQDTLALGYILPAVGRIRDFHPLKHAPAGRTINLPHSFWSAAFLIMVSAKVRAGYGRAPMYPYRVRASSPDGAGRHCIRFFMRLILAFRCLLLRWR